MSGYQTSGHRNISMLNYGLSQGRQYCEYLTLVHTIPSLHKQQRNHLIGTKIFCKNTFCIFTSTFSPSSTGKALSTIPPRTSNNINSYYKSYLSKKNHPPVRFNEILSTPDQYTMAQPLRSRRIMQGAQSAVEMRVSAGPVLTPPYYRQHLRTGNKHSHIRNAQ